MDILVYFPVGLLVLLVVYASSLVTYHTARSDLFEQKQKIVIITIAWLVPIIAPAFIITILNEDKPIARKPGIALLDLIFLSAVFNQNTDSGLEGSSSVDHDLSSHGGGGDQGGSRGIERLWKGWRRLSTLCQRNLAFKSRLHCWRSLLTLLVPSLMTQG